MTTTHIGKIGRLPKCTRDALGQRIEDNEPGTEIVKWLNGLPGVRSVLKDLFGGRPITEQNLSEWKQTGHPEWARHEASRLTALRLTEHSDDLVEAADGQEISDRLAKVLAAEMAGLALALLEKETDSEKRWQRLCAVHQQLSQLRRDDHRAVRTAIKRERWDEELERQEQEEEERVKKANKERLTALCLAPMLDQNMAEFFGDSEEGKRKAELLHRIKFDLPVDDLIEADRARKIRSGHGPAKSNPIQPNPAESSLIQPKNQSRF
jgi:hypothetical protein